MGYFNNGQFNLVVSLRYTPATNEIAFLQVFFEQVSQLLYDLTDGVHSIGMVLISGNSMGGADADIWIHPNANVWPNSTSARLWFPLESLDISQDFMYYATILAHELSHYLYDVRDEYNNNTSCQGNIATEACLMEGYNWDNYTRWTDSAGNDYATWALFFPDYLAGSTILNIGQPSEFCHAGNHNATANNNQNNINHNQSCWTYMANDANHHNIPYGLTVPGSSGPITAIPVPGPAPITMTELIPVQRYMLVLDRSGSMTGLKIEEVKIGANFWADYVNSPEELGLVTYSTIPTLDLSMSEVPAVSSAASAWRTNCHNTIDAITAGGVTSIGDALRMGLNNIIAGGRASSQVMILFTDGLQNFGTETAQHVLPDLVAAGVRVYTIGLGHDQDPVLLSDIASSTGARYISIDGDLDETTASAAIRDALISVAGESRENGGLVAFDEIDGMSIDDEIKTGRMPFTWAENIIYRGIKTSKKQVLKSFTFPVNISEGSTHCTLGALWKEDKSAYRVNVVNPSGRTITPDADVRLNKGRYPYSFYEINNPTPGKWIVEVIGENVRNSTFRMIGFEVNNRVRFEVTALNSHIRQGEPILLRARILIPQAAPGARIVAFVRTPSGKIQNVKFIESLESDITDPYTYLSTIKTDVRERGEYLICINAKRGKGKFSFKLDELYRKKPGLKDEGLIRNVKISAIERWSFLSVVSTPDGPSKKNPNHGQNPKNPLIPKKQKELVKAWKKLHGYN